MKQITDAKVEQQQRKKLLEQEKAKKGKSALKGVGNTEESAPINYVETGKETGVMVVSGLAGGACGVALGKPSLFVGIAITITGLILKMPLLAVGGVGMTVASFATKNLTPEQQKELDSKFPKKEGQMLNMEREQARAKLAMKNAMSSFQNATYVLAEKEKKEEPKPNSGGTQDTSASKQPTGTRGFGNVPKSTSGVEINF
jgi:hypothetical protein